MPITEAMPGAVMVKDIIALQKSPPTRRSKIVHYAKSCFDLVFTPRKIAINQCVRFSFVAYTGVLQAIAMSASHGFVQVFNPPDNV